MNYRKLPAKVEDFMEKLLKYNNWRLAFVVRDYLYIEDTEHDTIVKFWLVDLQKQYNKMLGRKEAGK